MTATLDGVTAKKKPEPSAEERVAGELVRLAKEQGLSLTGPSPGGYSLGSFPIAALGSANPYRRARGGSRGVP